MSIGQRASGIAMRAIASGALAAGVSYYLLDKRSAVQVFGYNFPEWQADAVIMVFASATGDLLGGYALPAIARSFSLGSDTIANYGPPVLNGAAMTLYKAMIQNPKSREPVKDFIYGAAVNMAAYRLTQTFWGSSMY